MHRNILVLAVAALFLAGAAQAAPKTYDSNSDTDQVGTANRTWYPACGSTLPLGKAAVPADKCQGTGQGGDRITISTNTTPPVVVKDYVQKGSVRLQDTGSGTVTMEELVIDSTDIVDFGPALITGIFGPGAFIFLDTNSSKSPAPGQTGTGSTAPGGTVTWGLIGGWVSSGRTYCQSSPTTICGNNGFAHGVTAAATSPSASYDMGTWTFDANGDYEASQYIDRISNGALSNTRFELRGTLKGSSLPALPLIGFGVLALGLGTVGLRALTRKG